MSPSALLGWALSIFGWALVLTKGEGPWQILKRARKALANAEKARRAAARQALALTTGAPPPAAGAGDEGPATLLTCPMCVGTWLGGASVAAWTLADHWPALRPALDVIHGAGAGAGVAWLGVHLAELARRGAEAAQQGAWLARKLAADKPRAEP